MTHSREALVLKNLYTKWSGQARLGRGKVSSCLSEGRSKEGLGQDMSSQFRAALCSRSCTFRFPGEKYFCNGIRAVGGESCLILA